MKQRALQLINEGWEPAEVADVLGVSSKSIERWDHNYETHGCINPPSALRGRPRIINAQAADDLQELIRETPLLFLDKIGEWLALYHDISISTAAIHNNLCDLGLTYKLLRKAAAERDDIARSEWLLEITRFTTLYTASCHWQWVLQRVPLCRLHHYLQSSRRKRCEGAWEDDCAF